MMKDDYPSPEQILEELADKTAAQIDRLAPVAFDSALLEMQRYHQFLLTLNASQTPDGKPFNYAQLAGNKWNPSHQVWARQYARLFERAVSRIPDDAHFIRSLAYTPHYLLQSPDNVKLSPDIVKGILDLWINMMHRLEGWVTKRTTLETREGGTAEPRLALAGSDAKSYENVLPDLVGAWESLLQYAPSLYGWREADDGSDEKVWIAFQEIWPFLWQHLSNTAYSLAVAVWNEDEAGAAYFREALVRWPQNLSYRFGDNADLRWRYLLFPDIRNLDWKEARAQAILLGYEHMPAPTSKAIIGSIVRVVHEDVVFLTAALLLFWTVNDKQASDIGSRTALSLLRREGAYDDARRSNVREFSFRSAMIGIVRLSIAGERFRGGFYGNELDSLVDFLDRMTERRVVPGRIFTPSTLQGRDDLLLSFLAILLAYTPYNGDDGLGARIKELAGNEEVLPGGDQSLRMVLHEFSRFQHTLEQQWPQLTRGLAVLAPERDAKQLAPLLHKIITEISEEIENKRHELLKKRPISLSKIENIRSAVEAALLNKPTQVLFFSSVKAEATNRDVPAEWHTEVFGGIEKAQLVEPPMETPILGFEDLIVSKMQELAAGHVWYMFGKRPRTQIEVTSKIEEEDFWRNLVPLLSKVGPNPVLVISRSAEGRALRHFLYDSGKIQTKLRIELLQRDKRFASYLATIEGVDVFADEIEPGTAWLFSALALKRICYAEVGQASRYVEASFKLEENLKGTLRLSFRQYIEWMNLPIYEFLMPDSMEEN